MGPPGTRRHCRERILLGNVGQVGHAMTRGSPQPERQPHDSFSAKVASVMFALFDPLHLVRTERRLSEVQ